MCTEPQYFLRCKTDIIWLFQCGTPRVCGFAVILVVAIIELFHPVGKISGADLFYMVDYKPLLTIT